MIAGVVPDAHDVICHHGSSSICYILSLIVELVACAVSTALQVSSKLESSDVIAGSNGCSEGGFGSILLDLALLMLDFQLIHVWCRQTTALCTGRSDDIWEVSACLRAIAQELSCQVENHFL